MNISNSNKAILALVFGALTVLQQYPTVNWQQAVLAGLGTVLVWLVPNVDGKLPTVDPPSNLSPTVTGNPEKS